MNTRAFTLLALLAMAPAAACGGSDTNPSSDDDGGGGSAQGGSGGGLVEPQGVPILGDGTHDPASLIITPVATIDDGLNLPTDLEFHPFRAGELWITNRADDSVVVVNDTGLPSRSSAKYGNTTLGANHFLANPSGIAFSLDNGNMATIHEEDEITQPTTPADFMGPTLWSTDMAIFDGGHSGHLDMLHNSPNGMGIAWDTGNAFWIFDGYHSSLTHYDFNADHGPGGADHTDGVVQRCVEGAVLRMPNAPSHMEMDHATGWLYVADTGNSRIARLDTNSGVQGGAVAPNYDGSVQNRIDDAVIETFVDGIPLGNPRPSGLALRDGLVFVSDWETGTLLAYSMETAELVDYVALGVAPFALGGITFDPEGNLYVTDQVTNQVWQISIPAG